MFNRAKKRRRKNPQNITVSDVAEMTGFTTGAVRYWIAEGQLRASFDGYKYEIRLKDLQKFLREYYEDVEETE